MRSRARPEDDEASVTKRSGRQRPWCTNTYGKCREPQEAAKPRMPQVQVLSLRPRRSKVRFASIFLCKKIIRSLPCFSSFTKSHARFVCSVVNALATTRCRYQLFVSFILTRYEHSHQKPKASTFVEASDIIFGLSQNREYIKNYG